LEEGLLAETYPSAQLALRNVGSATTALAGRTPPLPSVASRKATGLRWISSQFRFHLNAIAILFNRPVTASSLIVSDPEILGGTPVFKGTRVPVRTLFEYLTDGLSLEYFLETFPSVTRGQAADVLRLSQQRIEQEIAA
jgi:uncharacterized protein (DUF433 family)